ncbi:MAG: di-heme oxidoredictase family protein, partial [Candidatus Binatia bacterium]
LWGTGNTPPFFHHGQYTTIRESILAHDGEAVDQRLAFESLSTAEQDSIVEFLKSLQVLPPGTAFRVVNENFRKKGGLRGGKARAEASAGDVSIGPVEMEVQP